jgi:uncharacterized membrane protein
MAFAGVGHLVQPEPFVQHLPSWVPSRHELIYATGLVEIGLGAGLLGPARWRPLAGLVLAAYLLAVFPSNVYVAVEGVNVDGQPGGIYPWLRLPFQPLFIALALWSSRAHEAMVDLKALLRGSTAAEETGRQVAGMDTGRA